MRNPGHSKAYYLDRDGTLSVVAPLAPMTNVALAAADALVPFVTVDASGQVTAFNGHVDLGTGIRTALAQIVAEELDVAFERVTMVLGDTALTPDQGPTIASETIQLKAEPLRRAAAQARHFLIGRAASLLGVDPLDVMVDDGVVRPSRIDNRGLSFGDLIGRDRIRLLFNEETPVKPVSEHRIVGQSVPRVDLPPKARAEPVFVHDARLPGMLHGRVVRPPQAGLDAGAGVGHCLISVDQASISHLPGIVATVIIGDFIGIVAEREEHAEAAMRALKVEWKQGPRLPDLGDLASALLAQPSSARVLLDRGDVDGAIARASRRLTRNYVWPYQLHGSIGPSAALADFHDGTLTVWSGTQNPLPLRSDLACLLDLDELAIDIIRMEASGCYGRNGADDVTADAALLSRATGWPVRVQLTRDQEHQWEPKGAGQLMTVDGGLDYEGGVAAYDFSTRYPSNAAPTLALILTGKVSPAPATLQMGDRTAIGPYDFTNHRVVVHDMAPIARAAWLRGVSALPNSFAHESYIDELAAEAGVDPVAYRLRYLRDPRAIDLVEQLASRAGWEPHVGPRRARDAQGNWIGRGFAYALYVHSTFPGFGAAWAAWVADVAVNPDTGEVSLTRITVGQDAGLMINPDGVRHQIHGNVIQSVSRVLKEEVTFSDIAVTSREWGSYPLLTFPEVPPIDVLMVPRPDQPPLGVGESTSVPSAAAIANAIFDATGVRFRQPPFTPERILEGLRAANLVTQPLPATLPTIASSHPIPRRASLRSTLAAAAAAIGAIGLASLPLRGAIAPIERPDPTVYTAETIERGRTLASVGGCLTCHTAEQGSALAGGRAIHTPFGVVFSSNITPDPISGIGSWSYIAFERAMREGLSRDGHHLFPAHPYTSFARTDDADLQALYAFLMAQPAAAVANLSPTVGFPFSQRWLMAGWNTLFHHATTFSPTPERGQIWNRGAYLVESLGHCSACHSPRNALGAERGGRDHLGGGDVDGWSAPALNGTSPAPIPWSEQAFFDYLRTGFSREHGAAGGPMVPVVVGLKALPDDDIRAMARYLASLPAGGNVGSAGLATRLETEAARRAPTLASLRGANIYEGACAVCHEPGRGPDLFGAKLSLALNTAVHDDRPDTLLRTVLAGARAPGLGELGAMPGFADYLDDAQIADLASYVRTRFAPDKAAWSDIPAVLARLRIATSR